MTLNIEDYLHPLLKHGLTKNVSSAYNATIKALNKPLQDAEYDILRSKTNLLLKETSKEWLDYFGEYLGLHRKVNEDDTSYRDRLLKWVLVSKNDVSSIRNAIADFLGTNASNIYIYEPYNDIFYLNYNKSLLNSMSYLPSTYYNYCVIDVKIDGSFPAKEVSDIINLFRPAGVLWIATSSINSFSSNAPIINLELDGFASMEYDITDYCGFNNRKNLSLTPSFNDDIVVTNPFYYNDKLSLLNAGREYSSAGSAFNDYMTFGLYYTEYTPNNDEDFNSARKHSKNYSAIDNAKMSYYDSNNLILDLGSYDIDTDKAINVLFQGQRASTGQYQVLPDVPLNLSFKGSSNASYLITLNMESLEGDLAMTSNKGSIEPLSTYCYALTTDTNGDCEVSLSTPTGQLLISENINAYLFNSGELTANHFAYNTSHYPSKGIGGCADIKHFLQTYGGMSTTVTPGDILNKYPDIYLTFSSYLNNAVNQNSVNFNLELFNFNLNMWVTVDSIEISKTQSQINYRIPDLTNYLNENGLLYYRLTSFNSVSCSLCLNLISLTFSSSNYNVPSLNWYYNSPELVSQNTFMNNTIGTWNGSSITDVSNTSIPYTKALYSETGQLIDNTVFNVVPGSTYYIDTWVQSSSSVSIEFKDTQQSVSLTSQDSGGWQHIVGNIVIPDNMFTGNFYIKNTDNTPLSLAYVAATLQQ